MPESEPCPECLGRGCLDAWRYVVAPEESHIYTYTCPTCRGKGRVDVEQLKKETDDV